MDPKNRTGSSSGSNNPFPGATAKRENFQNLGENLLKKPNPDFSFQDENKKKALGSTINLSDIDPAEKSKNNVKNDPAKTLESKMATNRRLN